MESTPLVQGAGPDLAGSPGGFEIKNKDLNRLRIRSLSADKDTLKGGSKALRFTDSLLLCCRYKGDMVTLFH